MSQRELSKSSIRMVYFDLGNVLLTFDHSIASRQLASLYQTSVELMHREVFESGLEHRYEQGDLSTHDFYSHLCDRFSQRPELADVRRAAADIFQLRADTIPVLAALKSQGMRTGILSNTCEAHWSFVYDGRYRVLRDLFDEVVLSYEERSMKPESKIYEAAIERAGVAPHEIFFMDDRSENVAGAIAAGIDAVLFTSGAKLGANLERRGLRLNY